MNEHHAHAWAAEYLRGTASSTTVAQFSRALACDADLRRWFLEYLNVDGALAATVASSALPEVDIAGALRPGRVARLSRLAAVILCALSPLLLLSWLVLDQHEPMPEPDRARAAATAAEADRDLITFVDFTYVRPATAAIAPGRWSGSWAADFQDPGHHVPVTFDAQRPWPQVTLAMWVRLDHSTLAFRALFHGDGWESDQPGSVHWMLTDAGTQRLAIAGNHVETLTPSVKRPPADAPDADSAPMPVVESGRWLHLATVYDATERTIHFYANGEPCGHAYLAVAYPARFGSGRLGNWDEANRVLGGRIDEFLVLGRALNDQQIRHLYLAGTPNR